jgi:hypothetical protein
MLAENGLMGDACEPPETTLATAAKATKAMTLYDMDLPLGVIQLSPLRLHARGITDQNCSFGIDSWVTFPYRRQLNHPVIAE